MKFRLIVFTFSIVLPILGFSQTIKDSAANKPDTIQYFKGNEQYFLKGQKLKYNKLNNMLNSCSCSAPIAKQAGRKFTVAGAILTISTISGIIALIRIKKEPNFLNPYTITLFSSGIIGIPLSISGNKKLKKSVIAYNNAILGR